MEDYSETFLHFEFEWVGWGGGGPSPLWTNLGFELGWTGLRLGLGGFGDKVLETGLDNLIGNMPKKYLPKITPSQCGKICTLFEQLPMAQIGQKNTKF